MRRVALFFVALSAAPSALYAQECLGQAPWGSGPVKVGGGIEIGDGYTDFYGQIGAGKDGGFFFGGRAGVTNYEGPFSQVFVGGGVGKELSSKLGGKVSVCPLAGVEVGLPKDDFSYFHVTGGLAAGYPLSGGSSNVGIILTGAFRAGIEHISDTGVSDNRFKGILDGGVGFVFNERISVVPGVRLYFGDGSDFAFGAHANIALGGKR